MVLALEAMADAAPKPPAPTARAPLWTPLRARLMACAQASPARLTWVSNGSEKGSKASSIRRPDPYVPSTTSGWPSEVTRVTRPDVIVPLATWAVASEVAPPSSASGPREAVTVDEGRMGSSSGGSESSVRRQDGPPASIRVPPRPTKSLRACTCAWLRAALSNWSTISPLSPLR